ncbi:hypothetical protein CIB48_g4005 [Xylaria polymorpha]|nr:hypothetical protein CIB48_g4005 [Xylaria polymorpha]
MARRKTTRFAERDPALPAPHYITYPTWASGPMLGDPASDDVGGGGETNDQLGKPGSVTGTAMQCAVCVRATSCTMRESHVGPRHHGRSEVSQSAAVYDAAVCVMFDDHETLHRMGAHATRCMIQPRYSEAYHKRPFPEEQIFGYISSPILRGYGLASVAIRPKQQSGLIVCRSRSTPPIPNPC